MTKFNQKQCSKCNHPFKSTKTMPEDLLEANPDFYGTLEKAKESASKYYGWTEENDRRFINGYIGIEDDSYDGVSYHQCLNCGTTWSRWTGDEVDYPTVDYSE